MELLVLPSKCIKRDMQFVIGICSMYSESIHRKYTSGYKSRIVVRFDPFPPFIILLNGIAVKTK
jgi:hypothetical protein